MPAAQFSLKTMFSSKTFAPKMTAHRRLVLNGVSKQLVFIILRAIMFPRCKTDLRITHKNVRLQNSKGSKLLRALLRIIRL
jgi:hypothetical protein